MNGLWLMLPFLAVRFLLPFALDREACAIPRGWACAPPPTGWCSRRNAGVWRRLGMTMRAICAASVGIRKGPCGICADEGGKGNGLFFLSGEIRFL